MADRQTSPVAPPSIALAMMAWKLAKWRKYGVKGVDFLFEDAPILRAIGSCGTGAYGEYYRIIDRISAGEAP